MPWLFSRKRKSNLKVARGPTAVASERAAAAPYARQSASNMPDRPLSKRDSARRKRRTSSNSSVSMRDADRIDADIKPPLRSDPEKQHSFPRGSVENITALPYMKALETSPHLRPITQDHEIPYNFHLASHSSLPTARERGKLQRPPTLRSKRSAHDSALPRRKSSKKRKNDHVREEEIRAMSMPLPQKRPAGNSGGILRRDSKKMKHGLNHRFERPTSNISLPLEESIHSSMSGNSESRAFRVSALDMFSPRPKIRYSVGSNYQYGAGSQTASRSNSRKERQPLKDKDINVGEEDKKERKRSKRIDELADTLDAGALREILERDQRRREKKKRQEEDRLRRRLERRAEKQRALEQRDQPGGTPAVPRGSAQGTVGLGIERDAATPMEDVQPENPFEDQPQTPTPVEQQTEPVSPGLPTPMETPMEEPVVADAKEVRYSRASLSPPVSPIHHTRGPSNISQMPDLLSEVVAAQKTTEPSPPREPSVEPMHPVESIESSEPAVKPEGRRRSSAGKGISKWASFLRRGKRGSADQGRTTPSEVSFSNTSRESMSRQPLPAHLVSQSQSQPIQIRRPSGTQYRGVSKFREDLPEYPLSPPDSRVQSPEAYSTAQPIAARRGTKEPASIQVDPNAPSGTYEDHEARGELRTDSPVSPSIPPSGIMSQSMASVDSEGSWLSGKPMNRRSNKSNVRSSMGSTAVKPQEDFNASYEELGIPDDEYFRRLTPQPDERRLSARSGDVFTRKPSSTAIAAMSTAAESDTEDELRSSPTTDRPLNEEEEIVHNVGRQPTVVHRQPRIKSAEGLLSYFQADEHSHEGSSPSNVGETSEVESPGEDRNSQEAVSVQRAKSIDLGKGHVRHLSAGSARLLDIPARSSTPTSRSRTPTQQD